MIILACAALVALAVVGVVCTLAAVRTDGYRRIPPR